ncbi:MAG: DUF29 domain-containing protein [Acidobacteriota bacterium]|jgi:hypothetical protein|nr:DUF29 domain-containing protein [Acidobacteriota bacterium]
MQTNYETDVIAWANEQAALLRSGKFSDLDLEHIADEVEDVGKSEQRELANRMALLLAHLLKWQFQPERRGNSWLSTIKVQRKALVTRIKKTPSLKVVLTDEAWLAEAWADAVLKAMEETRRDVFPEACPWTMERVLSDDFLPD